MEKQDRTNVSNLLLGGVAAAGFFYLVSKLRRGGIKTHTIPPIIIRSVSEVPELESTTDFVSRLAETDTSSLERSPVLSHKYIRSGFDPAKGIEVQFFSSEFTKTPFIWSSSLARGVRVEISLQRRRKDSADWEWIAGSGPHVVIRADGANLEVELDNELQQSGGNINPKRPKKREYKGNPNFAYRFGRILIYKGTSPTSIFKQYESDPADEHDFGDQYSLAFHNQL